MNSLLSYASVSAVLPASSLVWFSPVDAFWDAILEVGKGMKFIDVGTGTGSVPAAAREKGIDMIGIDVRVPTAVRNQYHVQYGNGETWDWKPDTWALVCRPCHNGFPIWVRAAAQEDGAGFMYVGFKRNLRRDVGTEHYDKCYSHIGKENESLYVFLHKRRSK